MDIPRGGSFCPLFPVRIGIRMIVLMEGGKAEDPEKNPRSKGENQQQTRPTCDTRSENRTQLGGWRRALSPLRQTYSPIITIMIRIIMMVIMIKTTMTIMMKIIIIIDKKIETIKISLRPTIIMTLTPTHGFTELQN